MFSLQSVNTSLDSAADMLTAYRNSRVCRDYSLLWKL